MICIQDIRVQADVHHEDQGSTPRPQEKKSVLGKLAYYSQVVIPAQTLQSINEIQI